MSAAAAGPAVYPAIRTGTQTREVSRTAPWYVWAGAVSVTSATLGLAWDVSWHRSIGRDTFWTAPHMGVYLCGVLAGVIGVYLTWQATSGRNQEMPSASISIFGLRAPLGVFIAGWGGISMLTAAPFDDWWHSAYGLDVKIVSPPHVLLMVGLRAIAVGVMVLILAAMNRADAAGAPNFKQLQWIYLYLAGLAVDGSMFFVQESTFRAILHNGRPYIVLAISLPILFTLFSESSRSRWACTIAASVYTLLIIGEILILPLFPAQPKLGPVFYPVTHFIPAEFPILIVAPAFALDMLLARTRSWRLWQVALAAGVIFTVALVAVEWPFASFLLSRASENRFFGTIYFDYTTHASNNSEVLRLFAAPQHGFMLARGLGLAAIFGSVSAWLGLATGRWLRGVQR